MGKTTQGAFDMVYHHIDAPTVQDDEYGREFKKRKLIVPGEGETECYRSPLLAYLADSPWVYSRKVDGENIRIQWDGEQALWNGKSNAFQCSAEFTDYMNRTFLEEIFEEKLGRDKVVTIFGEKMGPKTQGNELGLGKEELVIFDVNINGAWLCGEDVVDVADYFRARTVFDFMPGALHESKTLRELIEMCAKGDFKDWEGIVATPLVECRDQKGSRVIVKIKTKDYLRTEGGKQNGRV